MTESRKARWFALCAGKGKVRGASLPLRASQGSAGYDFFAPAPIEIPPGETVLVPTGVKAYMQPGEVLELNVRSSQGVKDGVILANVIGWVDADYADNPDNEGCIGIALRNLSTAPVKYQAGDRIGQGKFSRCLFVDEDAPAGPRQGGFGSSGR